MPEDFYDDTVTPSAVVLDRRHVQIPYMPGELPGAEPGPDYLDEAVSTEWIEAPIDPEVLMKAVKTNGALHAVLSAVADGCAGLKYAIEPRVNIQHEETFDEDDRKTWSEDVKAERNQLQVFIQAGFMGRGAMSLRHGFKEQEMDRVILGWGGVVVTREPAGDKSTMPPPPQSFSRFEACKAKWSKPDREPTMTPVPIALEDGTIWWVEEPRFFRRLKVSHGNGRATYYKEYGDWRTMDRQTGKYLKTNRYTPSVEPGQPGQYEPGKLKKGQKPALEVMAWRTTFPGAYPYGHSGWHSELQATFAANEHVALVLTYLKSGLHAVVLAAANRPFDAGSADAAIKKIDELGRGRAGLGSLITLSLIPQDSMNAPKSGVFNDESTADRGRLILHQLSTQLPKELLESSGLQQSLGLRFSESERIPALLVGRSDSYNFATASAAWSVVNRLRFGPHHEEREAFLDRICVEMGIVHWRIVVQSPDWDEREKTASIMSTAGNMAGVSVNGALKVFAEHTKTEYKPVDHWWGDVSIFLVREILKSDNPKRKAAILGVELPADYAMKYEDLIDTIDKIDKAVPGDTSEDLPGGDPNNDGSTGNETPNPNTTPQ